MRAVDEILMVYLEVSLKIMENSHVASVHMFGPLVQTPHAFSRDVSPGGPCSKAKANHSKALYALGVAKWKSLTVFLTTFVLHHHGYALNASEIPMNECTFTNGAFANVLSHLDPFGAM